MTNKLFELADFFVKFNVEKKPGRKGFDSGKNKLTQNGGTDRVKPPHFHMYMQGTSTNSYSYEVDLQRLLCLDEIYFSRVIDIDYNIDVFPGQNGQSQFSKYASIIYDIMWMKPNVKKPEYLNECHNNIEAAIRIFNHDADLKATAGINVPQEEKLFAILKEKSNKMKIMEKFNICFEYIPKDVRDKYKECFEKPF